ncbi:uncharacterized protein LOC144425086 [Styela clava]
MEEVKQSTSHVCCFCGKSFRWISRLINHQLTHTKERSYKCDICGKGFIYSELYEIALFRPVAKPTDMQSLRESTCHMRQHTGERPYKCDECGKGFCDNSTLRKHMNRPMKKFVCEICERPFGCKPHLSKHAHSHTKEKKFGCTICNKFATNHEHLK